MKKAGFKLGTLQKDLRKRQKHHQSRQLRVVKGRETITGGPFTESKSSKHREIYPLVWKCPSKKGEKEVCGGGPTND